MKVPIGAVKLLLAFMCMLVVGSFLYVFFQCSGSSSFRVSMVSSFRLFCCFLSCSYFWCSPCPGTSWHYSKPSCGLIITIFAVVHLLAPILD